MSGPKVSDQTVSLRPKASVRMTVKLSSAIWATVWLTVGLAGVLPLFAYGMTRFVGELSLPVLFVGFAGCWVGGTAALFAPWLTQKFHPVTGVLFGSLCRTAIPLTVAVVATVFWGPFRQLGGFGIMVAYFLWMLLCETLLSLWLVQRSSYGTWTK